LENADTVLAYLDSMDPDEFTEAMVDPENFGTGKSFFMAGRDAGFDMTDEDERNTFMRVYDLDALSDDLPEDDPSPRGPSLSDNPRRVHLYSADEAKKKKNKRKQAKVSRKKNRKK